MPCGKNTQNTLIKNSLTPYERRLLRSWVRDGHSVNETVESRYLLGPAYPPMDFIEAYRLDREQYVTERSTMKKLRIAENPDKNF